MGVLKEEEEREDEVAGDGGVMVVDDELDGGVGGEEERRVDVDGEPGWRLVFGSCLMVGVSVEVLEEKRWEVVEQEQEVVGSGLALAEAEMPLWGVKRRLG